MAVCTAMQWRISDQENLEEFYYKKALINVAFAEIPLEECLQSLEDKGLLASVEGQDDLAVLYQLLNFRKLKGKRVSFADRL